MKAKQESARFVRLGHLVVIWIVAMSVSAFGFWTIYGSLTPFGELVSLNLLVGPLALPFAFVHAIIQPDAGVLRIHGMQFVALELVYWSVLLCTQGAYIWTGNKLSLLMATAIILLSSWYWHYYAQAMIGI